MGIVKNVGYRAVCIGIAGLGITAGTIAVDAAVFAVAYAGAAVVCAIKGPEKTEPEETPEE